MLHQTVIIECSRAGPVPGYQVQQVNQHQTITSVLQAYCDYKGVVLTSDLGLIDRSHIWLESGSTLAQSNVRDGDRLFLVSSSDLVGGGHKVQWNRWWTLAAATAGTAFLGLLVICLVYTLAGSVPFNFGVVFDAGSTHTEMLLYEWKGEKWRDTGIVEQLDNCELQGGIGSLFASEPSGVREYLRPCIAQAKGKIPSWEQADSPIFLAATAGLRMLQLDEPSIVDQIIGNITEEFSKSGLKFKTGDAKVISGQEEALAGWVTVNVLAGKLLPGDTPHTVGGMLGALDMGGASTQITFEVAPGEEENLQKVKLYGQDYELRSDSYLCHGIAQVVLRHQVWLLKNETPSEELIVNNPCLANGYTVSPSPISMKTPCSDTTYLANFSRVEYKGTGNFTECLSQLQALVLDSNTCKSTFIHPNCLENPPSARKAATSFMGFANFYYAAAALNMTSNVSGDAFLQKVKEVCELESTQLFNTTFPELDPKYIPRVCYLGLYVYTILNDFYKFTPDEWSKITFAKSIQGSSVGWTLGFMTENTNAIPSEGAEPGMPVGWFVVLTFIFVGLVGLSVWLVMKAMKFGHMSRVGHSHHTTSYGTLA